MQNILCIEITLKYFLKSNNKRSTFSTGSDCALRLNCQCLKRALHFSAVTMFIWMFGIGFSWHSKPIAILKIVFMAKPTIRIHAALTRSTDIATGSFQSTQLSQFIH